MTEPRQKAREPASGVDLVPPEVQRLLAEIGFPLPSPRVRIQRSAAGGLTLWETSDPTTALGALGRNEAAEARPLVVDPETGLVSRRLSLSLAELFRPEALRERLCGTGSVDEIWQALEELGVPILSRTGDPSGTILGRTGQLTLEVDKGRPVLLVHLCPGRLLRRRRSTPQPSPARRELAARVLLERSGGISGHHHVLEGAPSELDIARACPVTSADRSGLARLCQRLLQEAAEDRRLLTLILEGRLPGALFRSKAGTTRQPHEKPIHKERTR